MGATRELTMHENEHPRRLRAWLPAGFTLAAVTLALAGCGSVSNSSTNTATQAAATSARQTPAQSGADVGSAAVQANGSARSQQRRRGAASPGSDTVTKAGTTQVARQTPDSANDDENQSGSPQLNPCTLVSLSEAQAITHGHVKGRIEAPLGPTCIYRTSSSGADITMAVQSMSFPQVSGQLARRQQLTVAGRRAYCGRLGAEMLVVALPHRQLLNVSAPCGVAQQFATLALKRLAA